MAACRRVGGGVREAGLLQQPTPPPPPNSIIVESCLFSLGCGENCCEKIGSELFGALSLETSPYLDLWLFLEKQFPAQMFPSTPTRPGFLHWASLKEESRCQAPSALFPLVPLPPLFQSPPSCSPMHFKTDETEASLAVQQSSQKRVPICRGYTLTSDLTPTVEVGGMRESSLVVSVHIFPSMEGLPGLLASPSAEPC